MRQRIGCLRLQHRENQPGAPLLHRDPPGAGGNGDLFLHKLRVEVDGDVEERSWVREDRHRAENLERGRKIPAFTKKKEVTPKAPGRRLGSDKERGRRFQIQSTTKKSRDSWISRKKCDVR